MSPPDKRRGAPSTGAPQNTAGHHSLEVRAQRIAAARQERTRRALTDAAELAAQRGDHDTERIALWLRESVA